MAENGGAEARIERLKYTYLRALDTNDWDLFASTLVPDVRGDYGSSPEGTPLRFSDRDSLVDYLRGAMGSAGVVTEHAVTHPEIDVADDGRTATGTWYLHDRVIVPEFDFLLVGAAFYSDEYRLTDDGWRIAATGYERTYEATGSLSAAGLSVHTGPAMRRPDGR